MAMLFQRCVIERGDRPHRDSGEGGDASKSGACWLGAEILHGDVILTDRFSPTTLPHWHSEVALLRIRKCAEGAAHEDREV